MVNPIIQMKEAVAGFEQILDRQTDVICRLREELRLAYAHIDEQAREITVLKAVNHINKSRLGRIEQNRLSMMLEEDKRRASLMDDCINPKVPSSLGSWLKEETCQTGSAFRRNIDGQTHVEGHNCPSC